MSITTKPTRVLTITSNDGGAYYENKEKQVTTTPSSGPATPTVNEKTTSPTKAFVAYDGSSFAPTPTPPIKPNKAPTPKPTPTPTLPLGDRKDGGGSTSYGSTVDGETVNTTKILSLAYDGDGSDSSGGSGGESGGGFDDGDGINEALGTPDFTWEQDAAKRAGTQLSKDVETTRKEFLESRKQLDQAAQQGQDQYSMSKYTLNQSIEKAGWAGGYVLDAQRQTEYLKQSIKAQMYGQMELQAMGYDSQLAAARLAYDLGKQDLARQYYQDAVANQIQKAQLTGVWVSPEVNDMLTQYQAASAILAKKEGLSDEEKLLDKEYQQARHLKDQIVNWFAETGLSETGVDTLAKMTFNLDVQALNEAKIQAALEAIEPGQYAMKNEDGSYKMDKATGRPEIIDLNVASPEEQWDFFNTSYGHIALRNQVNNLASQTMQNFINNTPGLSDMSDSQFQTAFDNYLKSGTNDLVKDYVNQFGSNDIMQRLINTHPEVFVDGQYTFSIKSGDNTYTYKFNKTTGTGGTTDVPNKYRTDAAGNLLVNDQVYTEGSAGEVIKDENSFFLKDSNGAWIQFDANKWNEEQIQEVFNNSKLNRSVPAFTLDQKDFETVLTDISTQFNQGAEQTAYTKGIAAAAKAGLIPDNTYINLNYGYGTPKLVWFYNGNFYESQGFDGEEIRDENVIFSNGLHDYAIDEKMADSHVFLSALVSALGNNDTTALSSSLNSSSFGNFKGNDDRDSKQNQYVNSILAKARNNTLPEGSIIDMNYGAGTEAYYMWMNGKFYKVPTEQSQLYYADEGIIIDSDNYQTIFDGNNIYKSDFYKSIYGTLK